MAEEMYTGGQYLHNCPTWHTEDSLWKGQEVLKMIRRNGLRPGTVCDVGCGAGEVLNQLYVNLPPDVQFVGYDISPQAYELCRARQKDRLRFVLGSPLDDANAMFDLVMAIDVFEHVEDYLGFLRKLLPKGRCHIFKIPLELYALKIVMISRIMAGRRDFGHLHYFAKETALASLADTGYEIVDHFYASGVNEMPRTWAERLVKWPRRFLLAVAGDLGVRLLGGYSLVVLTRQPGQSLPAGDGDGGCQAASRLERRRDSAV